MTIATSSATSKAPSARPNLVEYGIVTAALAATIAALVVASGHTEKAGVRTYSLLGPLFSLLLLTAVVWLAMVLARNVSVALGKVSAQYYAAYSGSGAPPDWIERPARTFNNLMQVPMLFYVLVSLMMATGAVDAAQILLAWIFVATRVVHAFIYIVFNQVAYRFASYTAGCITLGVLWVRFAEQTWSAW
jgi:hypothetical protein